MLPQSAGDRPCTTHALRTCEQHIGTLDVQVHDRLVVQVVERARQLQGHSLPSPVPAEQPLIGARCPHVQRGTEVAPCGMGQVRLMGGCKGSCSSAHPCITHVHNAAGTLAQEVQAVAVHEQC